jgi:PAS domain S-box-containing protein
MSNNRQGVELPMPTHTETPSPTLPSSEMDPNICHVVMESMPDGIILVDETRRIVAANIATEDIFGYSRDELISQSVDMLVPDKHRQRHVEQSAAFFANPVRGRLELPDVDVVRKDGSELTVSIRLGPIYSGDLVLACAVIRDISQSKRVERALHDAEAQVRLLLDSTEESIYGLDTNGNATFCNRACVETLGYECPEDLLGKNMHDVIHHTRRDGSPFPMEKCQIFQAFRIGVGIHVDDEVFWKADGSRSSSKRYPRQLSWTGSIVRRRPPMTSTSGLRD